MAKGKAFDPALTFWDEESLRDYGALTHAIQCATKHDAARNLRLGDPIYAYTDNRIGINVQMAEWSGVLLLLVKKGIITPEEARTAVLDGLRNELARFEATYPRMEFV